MLVSELVYSIAIGIAIGGVVFAGLASRRQDVMVRKALALSSFAVGGTVAWWLSQHPDQLGVVMGDIVGRAIAILLAALGAALIIWKIKSLFLG